MIKDLIKTKFIKNQALGLDFNISKELEYANNVYNNIKHSTIGFSPNMIFNSKDELVYKKVKENTIKSQIKRKNNIIIENDYGLLAEYLKFLVIK